VRHRFVRNWAAAGGDSALEMGARRPPTAQDISQPTCAPYPLVAADAGIGVRTGTVTGMNSATGLVRRVPTPLDAKSVQ